MYQQRVDGRTRRAETEQLPEPTPSVESLLVRCRELLSEVSALEQLLARRGRGSSGGNGVVGTSAGTAAGRAVILRNFRSSVVAEEQTLLRLQSADQASSKTVHKLRSSNLPFCEAVWRTAKASRHIVGLQRQFHWIKSSSSSAAAARNALVRNAGGTGTTKAKKRSTLVDIVAEEGLEWIKLSTVSESKLLFQKAKMGWEDEDDSSGDDLPRKVFADGAEPLPGNEDTDSEDEDGTIELVRVARDLYRASRATWAQYRHPTVLIVLPNLEEGRNSVVDGILRDVRNEGVTVRCGWNEPSTNSIDQVSKITTASINQDSKGGSDGDYTASKIETTADTMKELYISLLQEPKLSASQEASLSSLRQMLPLHRPKITSTANLDCTVLLAIISDLSHYRSETIVVPENPHPSLLHQIDIERESPLLPNTLYPGLDGVRRLVTSRNSASRMWDIVNGIGTPSEKRRTELLFGTGTAGQGRKSEELLAELARDSVYRLPSIPLPIEILAEDEEVVTTKGDTTAEENATVKEDLKLGEDLTRDNHLAADDGQKGAAAAASTAASASPPSSDVLARLVDNLSDINRSVFLLGWKRGWTTVTSNKLAAKTIESILVDELEKAQTLAETREGSRKRSPPAFEGPLIWTIDVARSLVGKERGRGG